MPKRIGHLYEQLSLWNNLVACEIACCNRRTKNFGVRMHIKNRWQNLVDLQEMIIDETIRTDEYQHEQRRSGQDKLRDIAKLKFHPNHIWHRDLVYVGNRRVDRSLINNTFASRVGYGQIKAALYIRDYIRKHPNATVWYCQGDFVKYYQNIKHSDIRKGLERRFKDERYINAFIEPFSKFSPSGKEIPLGINPSQTAGNIVRSPFDRYATEVVKCKGYMSYLDDFVFFGAAKGEVKRKMKQLYSFAEKEMDYELHIPKIRKLSEGLNTMGFVFYPNGSMYWRKTNKAKWLKRRSKVTNPKRKRELDAAAWGMLKWGNKHCKRLYKIKTGNNKNNKKKMSVGINDIGIGLKERVDKNGAAFFDCPKINMSMVLNKPIEILRVARNATTSYGEGRYILEVRFMGEVYKLITNSIRIKPVIDSLIEINATKIKTVFIDAGDRNYAMDVNKTEVLEVGGRPVEILDGVVVYSDNKEKVQLSEGNIQ